MKLKHLSPIAMVKDKGIKALSPLALLLSKDRKDKDKDKDKPTSQTSQATDNVKKGTQYRKKGGSVRKKRKAGFIGSTRKELRGN